MISPLAFWNTLGKGSILASVAKKVYILYTITQVALPYTLGLSNSQGNIYQNRLCLRYG